MIDEEEDVEIDCLVRVGAKWRLRYIVVFGSRARGYAGPHSDYDIAVKAGRRLDLRERGFCMGTWSLASTQGWI